MSLLITKFNPPHREVLPPLIRIYKLNITTNPIDKYRISIAAFETCFVHYVMVVVYGEENKAIIKTCATLFPAISFFAYYLENTTTALDSWRLWLSSKLRCDRHDKTFQIFPIFSPNPIVFVRSLTDTQRAKNPKKCSI